MKKNFTALCIASAALVCANLAQAQSSRIYLASYLGLNTHTESEFGESTVPQGGDIEFDNAISFAGALGVRVNEQWRLEGEVSFRTADMDRIDFDTAGSFGLGGELQTYLFMLNTYYDFDLEWENITPFVSAGVGLAWHDGEIDDISGVAIDATDSDVGFAYQVGGGLKYRLDDDLAFTGGYRYLGTSDIQFDTYDFEYDSHEFRFGIEYDIPVDFLQ